LEDKIHGEIILDISSEDRGKGKFRGIIWMLKSISLKDFRRICIPISKIMKFAIQ